MDRQRRRNYIPDRSNPTSTTTAHPIGKLEEGNTRKCANGTQTALIRLIGGIYIGTQNFLALHQCDKVKGPVILCKIHKNDNKERNKSK